MFRKDSGILLCHSPWTAPIHGTSTVFKPTEERKGKSRYSAVKAQVVLSKGSRWITQFYLQITTCLPFLCKRSPDGANFPRNKQQQVFWHRLFKMVYRADIRTLEDRTRTVFEWRVWHVPEIHWCILAASWLQQLSSVCSSIYRA